MSTPIERGYIYDGKMLWADGRPIPVREVQKEDPSDTEQYNCYFIPLGETGFDLWLYVFDKFDDRVEEKTDWYSIHNEALEIKAGSDLRVKVTDTHLAVSTVSKMLQSIESQAKRLLAVIMDGHGSWHVEDAAEFVRHLDKLMSLEILIDQEAFS